MIRIAVVDTGSGNLASLTRALAKAGEIAERAVEVRVTTDPATVAAADRILLPGQGAFAACRAGLDALPAMAEALEIEVRGRGKPFLGICVGMQLMAERGLEHGETPGLGWFRGEIARLPAIGLPLPQMGWNTLDFTPGEHPLLDGVKRGAHAYFVHSYGFSGHDFDDVVARTDYGGPVVAMIARGNLAGTQFHVEKSGLVGLRILANFLAWEP
jgi:glutamine amidotransferase